MKWGPRFLSMGAISVVLLALGCGNNMSPIPAAATITSSGAGTITSSGSGFQSYFPTLGVSASTIYVVQNDPTTAASSILEFPASGQGSLAPSATLTAPANTSFQIIAVDSSGNLYVGAQLTGQGTVNEVLVYPAGATGAATPTGTITGLQNLSDIKADGYGQVYVLQGAPTTGGIVISVFAAGASGNAAPFRNIFGGLTTLDRATSIAVDNAGNIYVANSSANNILVFSWSATGNVAPISVIAGATTGMVSPVGIAVDAAWDIFATTQGGTPATLEFGGGTNGNVAPTKTLTPAAPSAGIAIDGANSVYTVATSNGKPEINVFLGSATGNAAPWQTITSPAWTGSEFQQIAVH